MNVKTEWFENIFLARHETFCPRYGWLKKGFDAVSGDPKIFDQPDAIETLGVGKNMIRAIRYWGMAFKIIKPIVEKRPLQISGEMQVTDFARQLFDDDNGWDPFAEDIATLWLLHWQLFMPPVIATAWPLAINTTLSGEFTAKDLTLTILDRIEQNLKFKRYSTSSIEKDASCFIRMYGHSKQKNAEEIECPFTQLDILLPGNKKQNVLFNIDEKLSLPDEIFLAACLNYAALTQPGLMSLSLNKIVYDFNSPGIVFRLSETEVGRRLEKSVKEIAGVSFVESYGNRQLQFEKNPGELYFSVLENYYTSNR